jgi:hypothetical protein
MTLQGIDGDSYGIDPKTGRAIQVTDCYGALTPEGIQYFRNRAEHTRMAMGEELLRKGLGMPSSEERRGYLKKALECSERVLRLLGIE